MDKLKIIKSVVVVLTFLLVFGILTALGSIYKKISAPAKEIENVNLQQPTGSSIEDFKVENGKLYLLVKYGGENDRILIIEPGKKAAEIKIN